MTDWQPIETAPRDGTGVDLWSPRLGRVPNCSWTKMRGGGEMWWQHPGMGPMQIAYPPEKHHEAQPTHWMSLPAPPVQS